MPAAPNTRGGVTDEDGAGEGARKWGRHGEIIAERNAERAVFQGEQVETIRRKCVHSIFLEPHLYNIYRSDFLPLSNRDLFY